MFYTIYKTTNKHNGKFYIGKHQTNNVDDSYIGSGKKLLEAIRKYGRGSFSKEVLFIFDNEHEMNLKEKELITEEFVERRDNYNMGIGGEGGPHFKGKTHTSEALQKIKKNWVGPTWDDALRKKLSENNKKTNASRAAKVSAALKGRKKSPEHVAKMKASLKKLYADRAVQESRDPHKVL